MNRTLRGNYEYTPAALQAIDEWLPSDIGRKDGATNRPRFQASMLQLQAELIRIHFPKMSNEDQQRAARTLAWLKTQGAT